MSKNRFTSGEVERLDLSEGDWVEIVKDLNTGEQKKLEAAGLKPPIAVSQPDGTFKIVSPIDWEVYEIDRAMIFLKAWSFRDKEDRPKPLTRDAVKALSPPDFEEVNQAIITYTIKRAAEKNAERVAREGLTPKTPPTLKPSLETIGEAT